MKNRSQLTLIYTLTCLALVPIFALSGYYIAKRLKQIYPEKKEIIDKIARECDITRIKAGLHYPSDGLFSKFIVDYFL